MKIYNGERIIRVFTCCSSVDSVARAPMPGMLQFNAHYRCNWCFHPGVYVGSSRGGVIKYCNTRHSVIQQSEENC